MAQVQSHATEVGFFGWSFASLGAAPQGQALVTNNPREKLVKVGDKVVKHSRYVVFQMAEVALPTELFKAILERIGRLGLPPPLVKTV